MTMMYGSHFDANKTVYVDVATGGSTDNTEDIKAAVRAAGKSGIVVLKQQASPYNVSSPIELSHSICITGLPNERPVIRMLGALGTYPTGAIFWVNAATDSKIYYLSNMILSGGTYGIEVSSAVDTGVRRGSTFENITFVEQQSASIVVRGAVYSTTWKDLETQGNGVTEYGLFLSATDGAHASATVFERCNFQSASRDGVFVYNTSNSTPIIDFINCIFEKNIGRGFYQVGGRMYFTNCHFEQNGSHATAYPDIEITHINARSETYFLGGVFSKNTGSNQYLPGYTDRVQRIGIPTQEKCYIQGIKPGNSAMDYIYFNSGASTVIKRDRSGPDFLEDSTY